jgi:integrating conjugative element protein (TIGR03752 family)
MKSNGLLKWLMIPLIALMVWVGIRLFSGSGTQNNPAAGPDADSSRLTAEEMKALGVEADSPRDTLATLVAQVQQLRKQLETTGTQNKQYQSENERLHQREGALEQRIDDALEAERERTQQAHEHQKCTQSSLEDLEQRLEALSDRSGQVELPVGLGLKEGDADDLKGSGLHWIEPQDATPADRKTSAVPSPAAQSGFQFATSFKPALQAPAAASTAIAAADDSATPVYTVPANATLIGSVAMTALIGRVPIDGTVNDPYPFKVLIGPENLTANGIELPEVAGAVVSGTASGDWTLSCVRGQIRSITFVFQDGTVRTLPSSAQGGDARSTARGDLGWISDPFGIPCVSGERRSNAQQYLGSQMLITAAGAGAASLIDADSGSFSYVNGSNGSLGTVGITGNEAMGRILAGGVQEMSQWINKLYGQAFAAVYVQPGARVAVHIEQPLDLDYDPKGRRVNHRITTGERHAPDLD